MTPCNLELSLATFLVPWKKVGNAQGSSYRCILYLEGPSWGRVTKSENVTNTLMLKMVRIIICQQFCRKDMFKRQTEGPFRSFWGPTTKKWLAKVDPVRIEDVCLTNENTNANTRIWPLKDPATMYVGKWTCRENWKSYASHGPIENFKRSFKWRPRRVDRQP